MVTKTACARQTRQNSKQYPLFLFVCCWPHNSVNTSAHCQPQFSITSADSVSAFKTTTTGGWWWWLPFPRLMRNHRENPDRNADRRTPSYIVAGPGPTNPGREHKACTKHEAGRERTHKKTRLHTPSHTDSHTNQ